MVSATYYFADAQDTSDLLDYLGADRGTLLFTWPRTEPTAPVPTIDVGIHSTLLVARSREDLALIGRDSPATGTSARTGLFNRRNLDFVRETGAETIVDLDASPVLFWQPGTASPSMLRVGSIGTQAESPQQVSAEYARWVRQASRWVQTHGTPVWGMGQKAVRPDLDVELPFLNSVSALPGALSALEAGATGRR